METLGRGFAWLDTGTPRCTARCGRFCSCLPEDDRDFIFPASKKLHTRRGFITKEQLVELAQPLLKTAYGRYLLEIAEGL